MRCCGRQWLLRVLVCGLAADLLGSCAASRPAPLRPEPLLLRSRVVPFTATAYAPTGHPTASGTMPHSGVVAADPNVLPLGSRIRVHAAGPYSGEYVVRDTGSAIRGHRIDIYVPKHAQARRFGRRAVKVEVIDYEPRRRVVHKRARHVHHRRNRHHHRRAAPGVVARAQDPPHLAQ
jgi:3D (Asp-Asp-Asp) domain-containing protein